jgi:hypothetical protein
MTDKKFAPIQTIGKTYTKKSTLVFFYLLFISLFFWNSFRSFYQFTVETLVLIAVLLSIPSYIWKFILSQSGYNLKSISTLIASTKQTAGSQRNEYIKELAIHIQISRRYHRVHISFDEELVQRLAHLGFVLTFAARKICSFFFFIKNK